MTSFLVERLTNIINRMLGPIFTSGRDPGVLSVALSLSDFEKYVIHPIVTIYGAKAALVPDPTVPDGRVRITVEVNL